MSDAESWMELCELYIAEQEFAKAAFCCEELILQNPNNHIYFQRYAEIKFTQGGFENMELAKSYYAKAVTLNSSNMRALYGLLLVCEGPHAFKRNFMGLSILMRPTYITDIDSARFIAEVPSSEKERTPQDGGLVREADFKMVRMISIQKLLRVCSMMFCKCRWCLYNNNSLTFVHKCDGLSDFQLFNLQVRRKAR